MKSTQAESKAEKSVAAHAAQQNEGPLRPTANSEVGQEKFGMLTVIDGPFKGRHRTVLVECDCGVIKTTRLHRLKSGHVKSCGCNKVSSQKIAITKHGHYMNGKTSKLVNAYNSMMSRCYRPNNASYSKYGGRGISVCERWRFGDGVMNGRQCFLLDMGNPPSEHHSVDRIDVNGDYSPVNCRWSSSKSQANNRSNNRILCAFGKTKTITEWSDEYGLTYMMLKHRIDVMGIPIEDALTMKPKRNRKSK